MDNPEKAYKGQLRFLSLNRRRCRRPPTASDLVRLPELNQARVHKCFLALANRKIITKDATSVCLDPVFPFIPLFLTTCPGSVSLAGPLIPLLPLCMIAVFPPYAIITGALAELIKCTDHGKLCILSSVSKHHR